MKFNFAKIHYNRRVIVTGKILEYYEYEKPVLKGNAIKRTGRANSPFTDEQVKKDNRAKTARRAKNTVRRTANANPQLDKFLTLTFAENITDSNYAYKEFDKFIKRVKTRFSSFQYINVIEFQKRGAIHFHLLCNLPYVNVNEFSKIWKHGFIKINRIDNVDNVGAYITKYMTKDNIDERLIGKKCYSMSKNLNAPKEYTKETDIDEIMHNLEKISRIKTLEYSSEMYGIVRYTQIICSSTIAYPNKLRKAKEKIKQFLMPLPDDMPCPFFP